MDDGCTRRQVLTAIGAAAAVAGVGALSGCQAQKEEKPSMITSGTVTIGAITDYHAGTANLQFLATYGIVIVNETGTPLAIRPKCTHQGCPAKWTDSSHEFECNCHGSRFNMLGQPVKGPATKPLPAVLCKRDEAGMLTVDLSKLYSL